MDTNDLLTINEVAAHYGITRAAVYEAIRAGKLPSVYVLGRQVIQRGDLAQFQPRSYGERKGSKPVGRKTIPKGDAA